MIIKKSSRTNHLNIMRQYNFLQKRIPGKSKCLDFSNRLRNAVNFIYLLGRIIYKRFNILRKKNTILDDVIWISLVNRNFQFPLIRFRNSFYIFLIGICMWICLMSNPPKSTSLYITQLIRQMNTADIWGIITYLKGIGTNPF